MADPSQLPPLPKDHLSHPENWATGSEPATAKQKGFIKVLEGQHSELVPEGGMQVDDLGKSEASEVIEKLKAGVEVEAPGKVSGENGKEEEKVGRKELEDMQNGDGQTDQDGENVEGNLNGSTKRKSANGSSESTTENKPVDDEEATTKTDLNGNGKSDVPSTSTADKSPNTKKTTKTTKQTSSNGKANGKNGHADEGQNGEEKATAKEGNGDGDEAEKGEDQEKEERVSKKARTEPKPSPAKGDKSVPIEIDSPSDANTTDDTTINTSGNGVGNSSTVPGDNAHLDHPENWTTGDEPATAKQKGFLKVLEGQKGVTVEDVEDLGKSEASEKIDELKKM